MDTILLLTNRSKILSGELIGLIPEVYRLKGVIERNEWHDRESVFDHTLSVLGILQSHMRLLNPKAKKFFSKHIGRYRRKDLLSVASLFHDIAKEETLIEEQGTAHCPGHEKLGRQKTENILKRFSLQEDEQTFITDVVAYHGIIHRLFPPDSKNYKQDFRNFKQRFLHTLYPDLLVLGYADTVKSSLPKTQPEGYAIRMSVYKKEIDALPPAM